MHTAVPETPRLGTQTPSDLGPRSPPPRYSPPSPSRKQRPLGRCTRMPRLATYVVSPRASILAAAAGPSSVGLRCRRIWITTHWSNQRAPVWSPTRHFGFRAPGDYGIRKTVALKPWHPIPKGLTYLQLVVHALLVHVEDRRADAILLVALICYLYRYSDRVDREGAWPLRPHTCRFGAGLQPAVPQVTCTCWLIEPRMPRHDRGAASLNWGVTFQLGRGNRGLNLTKLPTAESYHSALLNTKKQEPMATWFRGIRLKDRIPARGINSIHRVAARVKVLVEGFRVRRVAVGRVFRQESACQ